MDQPRDFVVPDSPAARRQTSRATVRVLVLDRDGRILLFQDSDPGIGASWWITPGGGIDPGETEHETVLRELEEETGLRVTTDDVIGPIARRHVRHGYSDLVVEQDDAHPARDVETGSIRHPDRAFGQRQHLEPGHTRFELGRECIVVAHE